MKTIKSLSTFLFALTLFACTNSRHEAIDKTIDLESRMIDATFPPITQTNRIQFDSLHYSVIRRTHPNGQRFIELVTNKRTKLDSWKEYYDNGQLKSRGLMTTSHHHPIGTWEHYASSGELDSAIDHDGKQKISYFAAVAIAQKHGFHLPAVEITTAYNGNKMYWEVTKWSEGSTSNHLTGISILIDSETGMVQESDAQKVAYF
ncbi:MAG: hypothetical protein JJ975_01135 [Bacteroidia bacterium]|nr:hypothetical protein [Bacteroidia bacterium]